jgi:hypothetical protein
MATINQPTPPQPSPNIRRVPFSLARCVAAKSRRHTIRANGLASVQPCGCVVELPQFGAVSRLPLEEFPIER